MFAFGGWPLFIAYLSVMMISLKASVVIVRNMKSYDAVGVGLLTAWTCYQVQSIISINQIGLAIWGWVLSGSLVAYSRISPNDEPSDMKSNASGKRQISKANELKPASVVYASIFGIVGLLISLPPVAADAKQRSAQVSGDAAKLERTMESSYFNPLNSQKYALNIQAYESSSLFEFSHKYALEAVQWNPQAYDLWRILYLIKNSTEAEKELAISNMKRLDPLNPDVTARQ
jgi:hypothetical protein